MKVVVLGGTGMLGHKLGQVLARRFETIVTVRSDRPYPPNYDAGSARTLKGIDVLDAVSLQSILTDVQPSVVVNAVGLIKQAAAANDPVRAIELNSLFPHRLADMCSAIGARLIHVSTDCVFSGAGGMYSEFDVPDALDLYGRSKLLGEVTGPGCLTLRTSMIGRELEATKGLVEWFLSNRGGRVAGYTNAVFSGLPTVTIAALMAEIVDDYREMDGLFHLSADPINKYQLLVLLRAAFQVDIDIDPVPEPVIDRSLDSSAFRKISGFTPPSWPDLVKTLREDASAYPKWRTT